ncbi:MAG: hypothetical protein M1819_005742 [Sarea resinae]|nr:MAG: hypothetical protein M1819_005742 [Sarea resinae]
MGLIVTFSMYPIRQKAYELFLRPRRRREDAEVDSQFSHVKIFDGEFSPYLWPCVAFWVFDRVVTLFRLAYLNYKVLGLKEIQSRATYSDETNLITLDVFPSSNPLAKGGAHYYVYFPTLWRGWENHPFTVAEWSSSSSQTSTVAVDARVQQDAVGIKETADKSPTSVATTTALSSSSSDQLPAQQHCLRFLIRPKTGITAHVHKKILRAGGVLHMKVLVEGPYGDTAALHASDNVLLVAGGSGITSILSYLQDLAGRPVSHAEAVQRKVHVVWAVPEEAFASELLGGSLGRYLEGRQGYSADIFITKTSSASSSSRPATLYGKAEAAREAFRLHYGVRPDIAAVIRDKVIRNGDRSCVLVCGAASMADDTRKTVAALAGEGCDVGYFEERFGW